MPMLHSTVKTLTTNMRYIITTILVFFSINAFAQVPYYKERIEDGKECRYFYSGVQNGQEQLVSVQCWNAD